MACGLLLRKRKPKTCKMFSVLQHKSSRVFIFGSLFLDDADDDSSAANNVTLTEDNPPVAIKIYESIEEFDKHLPQTVTLLTTPFGSRVYLVGTSHFSKNSQDDVSLVSIYRRSRTSSPFCDDKLLNTYCIPILSKVIQNVRPDIVMVELCPSRINILGLDEKTLLEEARNINITKVKSDTHPGYD